MLAVILVSDFLKGSEVGVTVRTDVLYAWKCQTIIIRGCRKGK